MSLLFLLLFFVLDSTGWGKTALGCDFPASYPEIENVKGQFASFVKRVFPHDVRDERALPAPNTTEEGVEPIVLDDLISLNDGGNTNVLSVPVPLAKPTAAAKRKAPRRVRQKPRADASKSIPNNAAAPFVAPASPDNSAGSVTPPPPSSPDFVASPVGPALHLPDDFDQVMGDPDFDFDDDAASSTFGFTSGFATDEEDPTLPFGRAFAPNFSSAADTADALSLSDEGMGGLRLATMDKASASATRPAPRPIHRGADFGQNREVGGSPGREGSFMPASDYRPSVLFQAFTKPLPPTRSSPLPPLWSAPLGRGNNFSPPVVRDCGAAFAAFALSARGPPPSSFPSSEASPSATGLSMPAPPSTPFSFPSSDASSAASCPSSFCPAPPSIPFTFPSSNNSSPSSSFSFPFPTPGLNAPGPSGTPVQAAGFSNRPPGAAAKPSALSVFKTTVASATAEVEHERTAAPYVPQYIQSRPPANIPKGHPLAPATQKAAEKQAVAPAPARRGRPRKQTPGDENVELEAVRMEDPAPAPATMSAAARAETLRINREAAALRRQSAALRKVEKLRDEKLAAEEKAAERLRASRVNPAGGAPLFVTSARPKRAMNAGKNADGTPIIRPKKRGADVMAEEDARIEAAFAAQKSQAATAKKRAGAAKKTVSVTAPRAGGRAGTRAAVAVAAKPAAKKGRT